MKAVRDTACFGRLDGYQCNRPSMMALIYGLIVFLIVEAAFSTFLDVWLNVGVDLAVLALFSISLLKTRALTKKQYGRHA